MYSWCVPILLWVMQLATYLRPQKPITTCFRCNCGAKKAKSLWSDTKSGSLRKSWYPRRRKELKSSPSDLFGTIIPSLSITLILARPCHSLSPDLTWLSCIPVRLISQSISQCCFEFYQPLLFHVSLNVSHRCSNLKRTFTSILALTPTLARLDSKRMSMMLERSGSTRPKSYSDTSIIRRTRVLSKKYKAISEYLEDEETVRVRVLSSFLPACDFVCLAYSCVDIRVCRCVCMHACVCISVCVGVHVCVNRCVRVCVYGCA